MFFNGLSTDPEYLGGGGGAAGRGRVTREGDSAFLIHTLGRA